MARDPGGGQVRSVSTNARFNLGKKGVDYGKFTQAAFDADVQRRSQYFDLNDSNQVALFNAENAQVHEQFVKNRTELETAFKEQQLLDKSIGHFDQFRQNFIQGGQRALGQRLAGEQASAAQFATRRGLGGSGIEQRVSGAVRAGGQAEFAKGLASLDNEILRLETEARQFFAKGEFDFMHQMLFAAQRQDFESDMASFQAAVAAGQTGGVNWGSIFTAAATIIASL